MFLHQLLLQIYSFYSQFGFFTFVVFYLQTSVKRFCVSDKLRIFCFRCQKLHSRKEIIIQAFLSSTMYKCTKKTEVFKSRKKYSPFLENSAATAYHRQFGIQATYFNPIVYFSKIQCQQGFSIVSCAAKKFNCLKKSMINCSM